MQNARAHIFVSGLVQGVFFRRWGKEKADALGVVGWIKNLADGRAEVVAEGEREKVNRLIKLIKKGPRLAKVEHIDVSWEEAKGKLDNFKVLR